MPKHGPADARKAALALAALGVVFGDIGTSPLYAVQTVFASDALRPVAVERLSIYGAISLIFWTVTVVVTVKYVLVVMRADNDGEGGLLSLIALLTREPKARAFLGGLVLLGIFGAALFLGDSMITPAISVLSAMEGLEVASPSLKSAVVPAALAVLVILFAVQRLGSGRVGAAFGPVMAVWFTVIAATGVYGIQQHPDVLQALSPTWAVRYIADDGLRAFLSLGGVVLAVTGAEALYADMGHFGYPAIRRAWLGLVFPALTLNYLGQGALLTQDPTGSSNPFFLLVPHWARIPMVALATVATVIASQAVISGAFSVVRQAARLRLLPRLRIRHTSHEEEGQIYIPMVNWALAVAVAVLVLAFGSSQRLAAAYGVAVTGTITITATLFFVLTYLRGRWPRWQVLSLGAVLIAFDVVLLGANLVKVLDGGWLPLAVAATVFVVLSTWRRGNQLADEARRRKEGLLEDFVTQLHERKVPVRRVPGTAVFLSRGDGTVPVSMRANVDHNHALHEHTIILTLRTEPVPHVAAGERVRVHDLGYTDDRISQVTARFGYLDRVTLPAVLLDAEIMGLEAGPIDIRRASYFISTLQLHPTDAPGMALWRKRLFVATTQLASDPIESFGLPRERTVIVTAELDV